MQLDVEELAQMQSNLMPQASPLPVLLDVREAWELERARITPPGLDFVHIPMGELPARIGELSEAAPIICMCHHGVRSALVASYLERMGFGTVYNLEGGIAAWSERVDQSVPAY
jgi:rhodanese-related sulfurtransferase